MYILIFIDTCVIHAIHVDIKHKINMKKYGFMEKNLYFVDKDQYYSSIYNKYIKLDSYFIFKNKKDLEMIDLLINKSIISKRIPILPKQECDKKNECLAKLDKFGSSILYEYILRKNISFRESISFFLLLLSLIYNHFYLVN